MPQRLRDEQRRQRRRARQRRLVGLAALGVVVAVAVAGLLAVTGGDDRADLRAGSVELPAAPPVEIVRTPGSYRIDYRLIGLGGGEEVVTSDRLWARRPFESRLESYDGAQPGGEPSSVQVAAFGRLLTSGRREGDRVVLARPPQPAASDVRMAAVVDEAVEAGLLERRERRRVAGRVCQVYRSGGLLSAGALSAPTEGEFADTCIDEAGLLLEEVLVVGGEPLLRRVAIEVEEQVDADDDLFATGDPTVPTDKGGGFVREVRPGSRPPGPFWELRELPDGFERRGRYAVVPPQVEEFSDVTQRGRRLAFISDVLVRGADVIVVDQGGTLEGFDPFPDEPDAPMVQLGEVGSGILRLGPHGSEVRADLDGGRFVRVQGTVDPELLTEVARSLTEVPGGELELLDD